MILSGYYYKCSDGESFDGIARSVYGNEKYAAEILIANPEHSNTLIFSGGERLYLPMIDIPEAELDETVTEPASAPWKE